MKLNDKDYREKGEAKIQNFLFYGIEQLPIKW